MMERRVTVVSRVGLHARPASLFVQAAARQPVRVLIAKDGGRAVDARSILAVLTVNARCGDTVVLSADGDGDGAEEALDALAALLATDYDAPQPDAAGPAASTAAPVCTPTPAGTGEPRGAAPERDAVGQDAGAPA